MNLIDNFISDLKELKKLGIKSFKLPMSGNVNYDIDEMIKVLKSKND